MASWLNPDTRISLSGRAVTEKTDELGMIDELDVIIGGGMKVDDDEEQELEMDGSIFEELSFEP